MRRIERDAYPFLCDDTERIRDLFLQAEAKRTSKHNARAVIAFWFVVCMIGVGLVFAKLWTMHAVAGIK